MKILQVIPSLSPYLGGPTRVALQLSKSLQVIGADVEILTTDDGTNQRLEVPLNQPIRFKGLKTTFLPRTVQAKEFLYTHALSKWHRNHLKQFHLIHTHYLFSHLPTWTARAARHSNIPYLMRPLGQLTPWALSQSAQRKKLYRYLIENRNLEQAAMIHCTSPGEVSDIKALNIQTPKLLLPLGVELPSLNRPIAKRQLLQKYKLDNQPILLFLSRLHPKKRVEFLLDVVQHLNKQALKINLLVAGSGEPSYEQHLQEYTNVLGISDRVTFTGFIDGAEKNTILQGSDLFLLPSYSENFGIAVAEALAAATPVVITPNVQIAPWIAEYNAGWIIPTDITQWIKTISETLQHPEILLQRGQSSRKLASTVFSWPVIAKELLDVYTNIHQTHTKKLINL
ncbi:glycosyltransferase [Acaryochloris marina]|uniref:glycosyltransferase n=1 Tax=Acaryochloris marina TaxID=155978 RepID=UPI001BAFD8C1|nr:glycosyltransferase [Acaryochloris marina]QUY40598.1 glycosyltransferase [Acaryochloris marina S15]